jgi:hypothetical protein
MRSLVFALAFLFSFSALALPKSVKCVFDYDDSLILKLSADFKSGTDLDLTQLQLFGKEEGEEDSDLLMQYDGPTEIEATKGNDVSWKFIVPGDDNDYGNTYTLNIPKDYARRLSVLATLDTGGWSRDNEYSSGSLSGSCTINQ